jgi:hypothetical protein
MSTIKISINNVFYFKFLLRKIERLRSGAFGD